MIFLEVTELEKRTVVLDGITLSTLDVHDVAHDYAVVAIAPEALVKVQTARDVVDRIVSGNEVVYGINTGFGSLVHTRIEQEDVEQLRKLVSSDACGLLITFAYPQEQMEGPPFALHDDDVLRLFANGFKVKRLETFRLEDEKDRGLSNVYSSVFKIQRID